MDDMNNENLINDHDPIYSDLSPTFSNDSYLNDDFLTCFFSNNKHNTLSYKNLESKKDGDQDGDQHGNESDLKPEEKNNDHSFDYYPINENLGKKKKKKNRLKISMRNKMIKDSETKNKLKLNVFSNKRKIFKVHKKMVLDSSTNISIFKNLSERIRSSKILLSNIFNPIIKKNEQKLKNLLFTNEKLKPYPKDHIIKCVNKDFEAFYAYKIRKFNLAIFPKYKELLINMKFEQILDKLKRYPIEKHENYGEKEKSTDSTEKNGDFLEKKQKGSCIYHEKMKIVEDFLEFVNNKVIVQNEENNILGLKDLKPIPSKFFDPFKKSFKKSIFAKLYLNFYDPYNPYNKIKIKNSDSNLVSFLKTNYQNDSNKSNPGTNCNKPNKILNKNESDHDILNCSFEKAFKIFIEEMHPKYNLPNEKNVDTSFVSILENN